MYSELISKKLCVRTREHIEDGEQGKVSAAWTAQQKTTFSDRVFNGMGNVASGGFKPTATVGLL